MYLCTNGNTCSTRARCMQCACARTCQRHTPYLHIALLCCNTCSRQLAQTHVNAHTCREQRVEVIEQRERCTHCSSTRLAQQLDLDVHGRRCCSSCCHLLHARFDCFLIHRCKTR